MVANLNIGTLLNLIYAIKHLKDSDDFRKHPILVFNKTKAILL